MAKKTKLPTVDIKGKEYVEVNTRVAWLRKNYPNASLLSEMLSNENGVCVFKTSLVIDDKVVATGHAYEKEGSTFINKTSYIENCETASWGRCLANYMPDIDGYVYPVASAEEVQNAIINQDPERQKAKKASDAYPQGKDKVQEALDALQQAFAEKDFPRADKIKQWAEKNDVAQVYDRHEQLFKQQN